MANVQIGEEPVKRKTLCFEEKDWGAFKSLKKVYILKSVSSLFRLFLRTWQKYGHTNLLDLANDLNSSGYECTINGLLKKVKVENKNIEHKKKPELSSVPLPKGFPNYD